MRPPAARLRSIGCFPSAKRYFYPIQKGLPPPYNERDSLSYQPNSREKSRGRQPGSIVCLKIPLLNCRVFFYTYLLAHPQIIWSRSAQGGGTQRAANESAFSTKELEPLASRLHQTVAWRGKHFMRILLRILRYMRPYWRVAVFVYACLIGLTLLTLVSPWLIGNAFDAALGTRKDSALFPAGWSDRETLIATAGIIFGLAVVRSLIGYVQRYGTQWLGRKVAYDLRMDLFTHLQRLPFAFYDRTRIGQLMSRVIGDVDEIRFFAGVVIGDALNLARAAHRHLRDHVQHQCHPDADLPDPDAHPVRDRLSCSACASSPISAKFAPRAARCTPAFRKICRRSSSSKPSRGNLMPADRFEDDNSKVLNAWIKLGRAVHAGAANRLVYRRLPHLPAALFRRAHGCWMTRCHSARWSPLTPMSPCLACPRTASPL